MFFIHLKHRDFEIYSDTIKDMTLDQLSTIVTKTISNEAYYLQIMVNGNTTYIPEKILLESILTIRKYENT